MIHKELLTSLNSKLKKNYDLLIVSASFEDRCTSILQHVDQARVKDVLVFYNEELSVLIDRNRSKIESLVSGSNHQTIPLRLSDPLLCADAIAASMRAKGDCSQILIDITAFTHETLLIILQLIRINFPNASTTCVYANAKDYSCTNERDEKWLSKGIGDVRSILGYPGDISPDRKKHLIVIVGYEVERALAAINAIEPHSLALGYGRSASATTEKDKDANEHFTGLVKQMAFSFGHVSQFEVPCNNACMTAKAIYNEVGMHPQENILLLPMNNKITTIGAALVAQYEERIQVCYAPAIDYNYANYSSPGLYAYIFDLNTVCDGIFEEE